MGARVLLASAWLGLTVLMGCGTRTISLSLPESIERLRLPTAIVSFEDGEGEGPRIIHALDARSPQAPLTVELFDGDALRVTLLAMREELAALELTEGELERAVASGDARQLPEPAEVYAADLTQDPARWDLDVEPEAAIARVRIAGKSGPRTPCDEIDAEARDVQLPGVDLRAVLMLPGGSALVAGDPGGQGHTLALVHPDLSTEPITLDSSGSHGFSDLAPGDQTQVFALTSAGKIFVIDFLQGRVNIESSEVYRGISPQDGGRILAWTATRTVELDLDLRTVRTRDDFPTEVERVAPDGLGGLFVMTSSAVLREQNGVWQNELCCSNLTVGVHDLFALGDHAMASSEATTWVRRPATGRWERLPEAFTVMTMRTGAMLGGGRALAGFAIGRLRLWDGSSWCDVRHEAESTPRAFTGIDADPTTGVFYAVTWFTGSQRLPTVVRGTFPL